MSGKVLDNKIVKRSLNEKKFFLPIEARVAGKGLDTDNVFT